MSELDIVKSREEKILEGNISLLRDGEYVDNGKIIAIPIPSNNDNPYWDKDKKIWYEKRDAVLLDRYYQKIIRTKSCIENGCENKILINKLYNYIAFYNTLAQELGKPTIPQSVQEFMEKYLGTTPTPKVETKPRTFSFDEVDKLNDTLKKL